MAKLKESIKKLFKTLLNTLLEYPVTIICIFTAAIFWSFEVVRMYGNESFVSIPARLLIFFAAGTALTEELGKRFTAKRVKIIGFLLAALISVFFVHFGVLEKNLDIFPLPENQINTLIDRAFWCYIAVCILMTIFLMYRRLQTDLPRYGLSVFISMAQVIVMYGLFAAGLAIIFAVFTTLIVDLNYSILEQLEIILASGIYVPAVILCFSTLREKPEKFSRAVVGYGLTGILCLAMLIVYIYIVKIVILGTLPKNELFAIVTALFVCGLPVWTMGQYFYPGFFGRLSKLLPYIFSPFIVLQTICIIMRVNQYGVTTSRYAGMAFIVFEILYLILYSVRQGKYTIMMLPLAALMLLIGVSVPGINCFAVSTRSQGQRLLELIATEPVSEDVLWDEYDLMREIEDYGPEGESFLEKYFPDAGSDFKSYLGLEGEKWEREMRKSIHFSCKFQQADISEYCYLVKVECHQTAEENTEMDFTNLKFIANEPEYSGTQQKTKESDPSGEETSPELFSTNLDLSNIIRRMVDYQEEGDFLQKENYFRVRDDTTLFITNFSASTDQSGTMDYLNISGYLLLK